MSIQEQAITRDEHTSMEEMRELHAAAYGRVRENPQETHEIACKVRDVARAVGDYQEWGKSLLTIGIAKCMMNKVDEGKASFWEARSVLRELGDTIGEARALHNLANLARQERAYTRAVEHCEEALALCNYGADSSAALCVSILNNMGMAYKELGTWQRALECYKQAERIVDNISDGSVQNKERVRQSTLNNIGGILHSIGDVTGAMEAYARALHIVQQWNNPIEELELLHNLANLYRHVNNWQDALRCSQRSLEIAETVGGVRYTLYPLMNLGSVLLGLGDTESAAEHFEKALTRARNIGDKGVEVRVLLDSVPLYTHAGHMEKAVLTLQQAIRVCQDISDYEGELVAMLSLSEQYSAMGQATQALPLLEQGLSMAEQLQSRLYVFRACLGLSSVYKQLGDYQQALAYHERYHAVEKEVFNEESDKKVQALMVQVQMERTEHERELYRSKAELLEQEVEFKRRELASHTLHLVERDKLIRTTERYLEKLQLVVSQEDGAELKKVLRMLKNSRQDSAGWDVFDEKFQELHGEFTGRLSGLYPTLSPSEVKVCVLMKLHLSTKEIAAVLHTGVRTVEAHRYRLRKKLGIDGEVNLVSWLNAL